MQTGKPAFEKIFGKPVFEFLSERPEQAAIFDRAMVGVHGRETAPFSKRTISRPSLPSPTSAAATAARSRASSSGIRLFTARCSTCRASSGGPARTSKRPAVGRLHSSAGDFFESVPSGADAYFLRHIIHDWDDEKALRILENVRRAMGERAGAGRRKRDPARQRSFFGKLLDLTMLVIPGGQERTEDEYRTLFGKAGSGRRRRDPARHGSERHRRGFRI